MTEKHPKNRMNFPDSISPIKLIPKNISSSRPPTPNLPQHQLIVIDPEQELAKPATPKHIHHHFFSHFFCCIKPNNQETKKITYSQNIIFKRGK